MDLRLEESEDRRSAERVGGVDALVAEKCLYAAYCHRVPLPKQKRHRRHEDHSPRQQQTQSAGLPVSMIGIVGGQLMGEGCGVDAQQQHPHPSHLPIAHD
jgi:hypothetical protein